MTFTPNPPPNYSLLPLENHKNHKNRRNSKYNSHERQKNSWDYSSSKVTLLVANRSDATTGGVKSAGNANGRAAYLSTLGLSLDCMNSRIVPVISGRRRTWFATGMNFGMERVAPKKHIHSPAADDALCCLFKAGYGRHDMYDEVRRLFEEMKVRNICPIKLASFTMIVTEGIRRNVWKGEWSISCFDLHVMSCGAACVLVHAWLLNMHSTLFEGTELPEIVSNIAGSGKHREVTDDGTLKSGVEALINGMGSPFRIAESDLGRFLCRGDLVATWLRQPDIFNLLVLRDDSQAADPSPNYPAIGN